MGVIFRMVVKATCHLYIITPLPAMVTKHILLEEEVRFKRRSIAAVFINFIFMHCDLGPTHRVLYQKEADRELVNVAHYFNSLGKVVARCCSMLILLAITTLTIMELRLP